MSVAAHEMMRGTFRSARMWKATIKVVIATIGIFAVVLTATVMLIEAATVDVSAMRDRPQAGPCQRGTDRAPL